MYVILAVLAILTNAILRSYNPSTYVPAQSTCHRWYGSPYVARTVATAAEFVFYRQVAITLGLGYLWTATADGYLFWLWVVGESTSWLGLLSQDRIANATEDIIWAAWFMYALIASRCIARLVLVPVVTYYFVVHIPSLLTQLKKVPKTRTPVVDELGEDGAWVGPSVILQAILFFVFLYVQDTSCPHATRRRADT